MLTAIAWILLGSGGVIAILLGVRRHRPARPAAWFLLAGSLAALATGDVCYALHRALPADICYLSMFAFVATALLCFTRGGVLLADRARLIDLLAAGCSTLLVAWVFVIGPNGRFGAVSAADVIGGLLLTGVAARLVGADRRNVAALLLLIGSVGLLTGDIAYPLARGVLTESGYVVVYVCWGLSALHPSMTRLTGPAPTPAGTGRRHRAALLAASAATPPTVLLIEALSGRVDDGTAIAVSCAITLLLTITRLTDAADQRGQALAREHGLRTAGAALVAAPDAPAVDRAVRAAIAQLLPAESVTRVRLATDDHEFAGTAAGTHSWWVDGTDPEHATLVCPLRLEPLAIARPSGGALILTGRRAALTTGRDALAVLAGQAALALDRIALVEAIGRRDSDRYLRTVIGNTADAMAVIDSDQRVRYASPALRRLLGCEDLPPLTTLDDFVHPDDRDRVRRALRAHGDGTVFCALQRSDDTQVFVEATYRDLREDRLVQGLVVSVRDVTAQQDHVGQPPYPVDELPAWVNRRSAQHKFRY